MAHSFFSSLRLVHGRACGGLFHSRATDTDETSVLACSRGRENGWWLREHFSLTNSPSRRRVQSVFGQLKSVYTVTVHLTLGGQSSDTSLPNLPGPFWSFALEPTSQTPILEGIPSLQLSKVRTLMSFKIFDSFSTFADCILDLYSFQNTIRTHQSPSISVFQKCLLHHVMECDEFQKWEFCTAWFCNQICDAHKTAKTTWHQRIIAKVH